MGPTRIAGACLGALLVAIALALAACSECPVFVQEDAGAPHDATVQEDTGGDAGPGPIGNVTVTTTYGPVRGEVYEGYRVFRGIPYAAPPVGDLRWRPPQPVTPWTAERDATKFGSECPQDWPTVTSDNPEDCLFLNVFSPDPVPTEPMPVMVWLGGGDNINGGSAIQWYHGQHLAQRGQLIVVTLNYRLGVLGFMTHTAFGAHSGNYGFLDQQAALRWVRETIGAFGGDKHNVTIAGLGAGADSICFHLTSPTSAGLFHRGSMESSTGICGSDIYGNKGLRFYGTEAQAELQGARVAALVGCDTAADVAACLRAKPQEELRHAVAPPDIWSGAGEWWGAHGGTADVPQRPLDAIEAGTFNKVPVILATARDETSYWFLGMQDITEAEVVAATEFGWGAHAQDVIALYPFSDYETPAHAAVAGTTDTWYHCPYRRAARDIAAWDVPVYFAYSTFEPPSAADPFLGAFQVTFECLLFHQDGDWCPTCLWQGTFTPEEHSLSLAIMDYWIRFFRTGDPNGGGAYAWPKFETGLDQHLVVDVPFGDDQAFHEEICDFYESL